MGSVGREARGTIAGGRGVARRPWPLLVAPAANVPANRIRRGWPARLRLLALALLLPFLGFSLLTPGTMLAPDALGRIMVVLCGDAQPVPMAVAADGSLTPLGDPAHQASGHAPCGWAAHAQPVLDAPPPLLPLAIQPQRGLAPPALSERPAPPPAPRLALARGPPVRS